MRFAKHATWFTMTDAVRRRAHPRWRGRLLFWVVLALLVWTIACTDAIEPELPCVTSPIVWRNADVVIVDSILVCA